MLTILHFLLLQVLAMFIGYFPIIEILRGFLKRLADYKTYVGYILLTRGLRLGVCAFRELGDIGEPI